MACFEVAVRKEGGVQCTIRSCGDLLRVTRGGEASQGGEAWRAVKLAARWARENMCSCSEDEIGCVFGVHVLRRACSSMGACVRVS